MERIRLFVVAVLVLALTSGLGIPLRASAKTYTGKEAYNLIYRVAQKHGNLVQGKNGQWYVLDDVKTYLRGRVEQMEENKDLAYGGFHWTPAWLTTKDGRRVKVIDPRKHVAIGVGKVSKGSEAQTTGSQSTRAPSSSSGDSGEMNILGVKPKAGTPPVQPRPTNPPKKAPANVKTSP